MPSAPRQMKIAELVRVSGVSRSTIHFYRNLGLLPSPTRRGPKLHVYGPEHLARLRWIGSLRKQGVPLEEIKRRCNARTESRRREPSRPAVTGSATRERILEHAAREFLARGFAEVHMADIAHAASVGKAKLYEHFRSKTALFIECLDHLRHAVFGEEQRAMLGAAVPFDDESRLRACAVLVRFAPYRQMANLLNEAAFGRDALHRMVTNAEPMFGRATLGDRHRAPRLHDVGCAARRGRSTRQGRSVLAHRRTRGLSRLHALRDRTRLERRRSPAGATCSLTVDERADVTHAPRAIRAESVVAHTGVAELRGELALAGDAPRPGSAGAVVVLRARVAGQRERRPHAEMLHLVALRERVFAGI